MRGIIMELISSKNKTYIGVILAVIMLVLMLTPVYSFAYEFSIPELPQSRVIPGLPNMHFEFDEDLGKFLGAPKIIETYSKTTKTYSKDFWSISSKGPNNIQNKIMWKVNKDKILDVYTNQRRMGAFIKPMNVLKDASRSNNQKWAMVFRYKFALGPSKDFGVFKFEDIIEDRITIFRDGRSCLKKNVQNRS